MKKSLHKILVWAAYKINLPHVIQEAQQKRNLEMIGFRVTNKGAIFSPEARVHNGLDPSKIVVGKNAFIRGTLNVFRYGGRISIGEYSYIGEQSRIWSGESITIGDHVLISHNVHVIDTDSHEINASERADRYAEMLKNGVWADKGNIATAPIVIEDYAWVSYNCSILKGVVIGKGAIIAAGSVVTKDVAPFTMVAGVPAVFIRKVNDQENL